jgi:hypothetical protein
MAAVSFELARPSDDEALRRLLRENPMAGRIAVSLEREPSYFRAAAVEGPFHQVAVGRDEATGEVVGMGSRSVRPVFLNGQVREIGYLSQLRVLHRPGKPLFVSRGLARGFGFLRELHRDGRTPFYLTSIVADNLPARRLLTAGLVGYPRYWDYAPFNTYALALGRRQLPIGAPSGVRIVRASAEEVPAIHACLERNGRRRQFAPHWRPGILFDPECTPDLSPEDFFVALRRDRVVGCISCWDQSGFKQSVVRSYSGVLGRFRALANVGARVLGWPPLPTPGSPFRSCYAAHAAVDDDDPEIFAALLRALYNHAASAGFGYAMLGMSPEDSFTRIAASYRHVLYRSHLYLVAWEDGLEEVARVDGRTPGPEVAVL